MHCLLSMHRLTKFNLEGSAGGVLARFRAAAAPGCRFSPAMIRRRLFAAGIFPVWLPGVFPCCIAAGVFYSGRDSPRHFFRRRFGSLPALFARLPLLQLPAVFSSRPAAAFPGAVFSPAGPIPEPS